LTAPVHSCYNDPVPVIKTKSVAAGDKAPNFSAADETGRTWSLKALKGKT